MGNAAAQVISGAERAIIAGGTQSISTSPMQSFRTPGTVDEFTQKWMPPTHPDSAEAPNMDMSITVGWNTAQSYGLTREDLDALIVSPLELAGTAQAQVARVAERVAEIVGTDPDAAAYTPGAVL